MNQGGDGVGGFEDVGAVGGGPSSCFVKQEVGQRRLDAFDPGGEDGLLADVAVDEEGGVGEQFGDGAEAAEGGGGGFEEVAESFAGGDLRGGGGGGGGRRRGRFLRRRWSFRRCRWICVAWWVGFS